MNEETKTLATIIRHQKQVSFLLRELAREFEKRADIHDLSKLQLDELEGFIEVNRIARQYAFGSSEYNTSLKDNKAIAIHFSRNSHHPEYWANEVRDMGIIDFIEMVIDWMAANRTYSTTNWEEVIIKQRQRFNLSECEVNVIGMFYDWFNEDSKK